MVPPEALERLDRFAATVDRGAPGILQGVYAVGSLALGDYRPPLSNLDVLALADAPWSAGALEAGRGAVPTLGGRHEPGRVAFLTWSDLVDGTSDTAACLEGRRAVPVDELLNPLTAQIMRSAAICTRGPEYPELSDGDLRGWAAARLTGRWAAWAHRLRHRPGALWVRGSTTEPVLEVARLTVACRTGRVVSKLEAGEASRSGAPSRAERILKDATGFRAGSRTSMYWGPFERHNDTLAYIEGAVAAVADVADGGD
jgi:hypothetical protein